MAQTACVSFHCKTPPAGLAHAREARDVGSGLIADRRKELEAGKPFSLITCLPSSAHGGAPRVPPVLAILLLRLGDSASQDPSRGPPPPLVQALPLPCT